MAKALIASVIAPNLQSKRTEEIEKGEKQISTSAKNGKSRITSTAKEFSSYLKGEFHDSVETVVEDNAKKYDSFIKD